MNKIKKRILSMVMAFMMIFSMIPVTAHAENETGALQVDKSTAAQGETIVATYTLPQKVEGVGSITLKLNYDREILECKSTSGNADLGGTMVANDAGVTYTWTNGTVIAANTIILTVDFKVKENAAAGTTIVSVETEGDTGFEITDIYSKPMDLSGIGASANSQTITIKGAESSFEFNAPTLTYNEADQSSAIKAAATVKGNAKPSYTIKKDGKVVTEAKNAGTYELYGALDGGESQKLGEVTIQKLNLDGKIQLAVTPQQQLPTYSGNICPYPEYTVSYTENEKTYTLEKGTDFILKKNGTVVQDAAQLWVWTAGATCEFQVAPAENGNYTFEKLTGSFVTKAKDDTLTLAYKEEMTLDKRYDDIAVSIPIKKYDKITNPECFEKVTVKSEKQSLYASGITWSYYKDNKGNKGDKLESAPKDAGIYWVTASATSAQFGTVESNPLRFEIVDTSQNSNAAVEVTGTYTYTGEPIIPNCKVTVNNTELTADDYKIILAENNINAGTNTASCVVVSTKNVDDTKYFSPAKVTFSIGKLDLRLIKLNGNLETTYDGQEVTAIPDFTFQDSNGTHTLQASDVSAERLGDGSYINAGTYDNVSYKVTAKSENVTGTVETVDTKIQIHPFNVEALDISVTPEYRYYLCENTDSAIKETLASIKAAKVSFYDSVRGKDVVLTAQDYDIVFDKGTNSKGAYRITATVSNKKSNGNLVWTSSKTCKLSSSYKIYPVTVTLENAENLVYDGTKKQPNVTLTYGSTNIGSANYTVDYKNNTDAGTATVTITGTGTYTGTVETKFTIQQKDISSAAVGIAEVTYNGQAQTPEITVDGRTLSADDYTAEYKNNTNAGTATVTITGKGNYTGTVTKGFIINKAPLEDSLKNQISGYSGTYDGKSHDAATSSLGNSYTVSYSTSENGSYSEASPKVTDVADSKTIYVKIEQDENHAPLLFSVEAKVTAMPVIDNMTEVTLPKLTYTGNEQTQTVSRVTVNDKVLAVAEYTVSNNTATEAGNYELTLTFGGNYSGTVTKSYSIEKAEASDDMKKLTIGAVNGSTGEEDLKLPTGAQASFGLVTPGSLLKDWNLNGGKLAYELKLGKSLVGQEATLVIQVKNAKNYNDYDLLVTIKGEAPDIVEGQNSQWKKGSSDSLKFRSNAELRDFIEVQLDGKTVDRTNYTLTEGSTIVELKASYVELLSTGKHTLAVVSTSGTASAEFTVLAKSSSSVSSSSSNSHKSSSSSKSGVNSVQTGDNAQILLYLMLAMAALVCGGSILVIRRRRENR